MQIYNTLTKKKEIFKPIDEKQVGMYTCGPTVYHYAHIGNLRSYIMEDVLEKELRYEGYNVKRVMNITDVGHLSSDADTGEDKMLKGAKREHKTVLEIAKFYTDAFFSDCNKLNIKRPDVVEPATNCIDEFIKMISGLLEKGYAYIAGGNVYFDTSKLDKYYTLSSHNEDDLMVGVRDDVDVDENKRNKTDFVLWFTKSKFDDQELKWDSPWGVGYPGWHIECSCISMKHLGENLDLHCGGIDNIFPHHTNEIAQSEAYIGHKWCNYWFHVHHLNDKQGKMSKSKGDFLTVSLLEEKGYNVMMYPLAISEYSDSELIYLMNMCNELEVYSLHIVDSFGSMKSKNVIKYISMMKQYLDESIIIGFHSYNNMQLSFSNATILLEQVDREVILDCSVHGIGIGAGNLNTEIILEYLNENYQGQYNDRNILEINDQFIENIYADKPWGYSLPNYLAAKHQCNTDYAYYLSKKNNLTIDEIDDIFDMLDNEKKVDFDKEYIEQLYLSYFESKDSIIDDFNKVKNIFKGKNVIMICPGKTSETHYNKLASLNLEDYVLVSINFEYKLHPVDYLFVGNSRRMKEIRKDLYKKVIASSNVPSGNVFAKINYSSLLNKTEYVKDNSGLMFLKLLSMCDVNSVKIIGMDGYLHKHDDNYISDDLMFVLEEDIAEQINLGVKLEIKKLKKELSIEII